MLKKIILLAGFCVLFSFCKDKKQSFRIKEDGLIEVLSDIQIASSSINLTTPELKDSLLQIYTKQILLKRKLDHKDLEHDLELLQGNPEESFRIFEKVEERVNKM